MRFPDTPWTPIKRFPNEASGLSRIIDQHYRQVILELAQLRGLSYQDAQDVTQKVLLGLHKRMPDMDSAKGSFRSYIRSVLTYVISEHWKEVLAGRRDRRREEPLGERDFPQDRIEASAEAQIWIKNVVDRAFSELAGNRRVTALRLWYEGLTYQEIATNLGVPLTQISNFIKDAKPIMREKVKGLLHELCGSHELPDEIQALLRDTGL